MHECAMTCLYRFQRQTFWLEPKFGPLRFEDRHGPSHFPAALSLGPPGYAPGLEVEVTFGADKDPLTKGNRHHVLNPCRRSEPYPRVPPSLLVESQIDLEDSQPQAGSLNSTRCLSILSFLLSGHFWDSRTAIPKTITRNFENKGLQMVWCGFQLDGELSTHLARLILLISLSVIPK